MNGATATKCGGGTRGTSMYPCHTPADPLDIWRKLSRMDGVDGIERGLYCNREGAFSVSGSADESSSRSLTHVSQPFAAVGTRPALSHWWRSWSIGQEGRCQEHGDQARARAMMRVEYAVVRRATCANAKCIASVWRKEDMALQGKMCCVVREHRVFHEKN